MAHSLPQNSSVPDLPIIHVISDSVGITAQAVARAAAAQFGESNPRIEVLPKVDNFDEVRQYLDQHSVINEPEHADGRLLVFYTLVDRKMADKLEEYAANSKHISVVDIMSAPINAIAEFSGLKPSTEPGSLHVADQHYFRRIEAIEYSIAHDDGRNPQDLTSADIVLIGVSRSSKTPLSIYLSQEGYKVANVPLDLQTEPPKELQFVDSTRLFGLVTTPEVLTNIRKRRLGSAQSIVKGYADHEKVCQDLEKARALMRKLGCIVIHTDNRAVEETAQEILRYYELAHPRS